MKKKRVNEELYRAMRNMVWENFRDVSHHGVILVSIEEMTNVFINLLAEFIEYQRLTKKEYETK